MTAGLAPIQNSPDEQLRAAVLAVVSKLQRRQLARHRDSDAVARLARLRHAVTSAPGSVPDVWLDTVGALPEGLYGNDGTSSYECAAHEAITLYALHQQSLAIPAHSFGITLGSAARRLAKATNREDAVRGRFHAIALAQTVGGVQHHLRAFVMLLRSEKIPLDYGQLAVDVRQIHGGRGADRVRLRWGRDFYRAETARAEESAPE